jgi:drug/metabolite transporter (DMT)-like permease
VRSSTPVYISGDRNSGVPQDCFGEPRCSGLIPELSPRAGRIVAFLSCLDFVGHSLSILGLLYAGSGTFQVIYATVVVFSAVWSQLILKRQLSMRHWLAVSMAAIGLSLSVFGHETVHHNAGLDEAELGHRYVVGVTLSFAGTLLFSFHYTVAEYLTSLPDAPLPHALRARLGYYLALMALGIVVKRCFVCVIPSPPLAPI